MPFFTTVERGMLKHIFWKEIYTTALPLYLGLLDATYAELSSQPGYARVMVEPQDFSWPMTGGIITNAVVIQLAEATGDWFATAYYFALYDSNGDLFCADSLDTPHTFKKGEIPTFLIDALVVKLADFAMSVDYGVVGHNAFSNYLKDRILRHLFGKEDYEPPDIWVGLLTGDPGDPLTNTNCFEVLGNGTGYSRTYVDPMDWEVVMAEAWNVAKIEFDEALVDWGIVEHFALFDTFSPLYVGNALLHGPVEPAKVVVAGSIPSFDVTVPSEGAGQYTELGIGFTIL